MLKYNIKDRGFAHAYCSSWWNKATYFEWDRTLNSGNICFYTDDCIPEVTDKFYNIAWLVEPPQITPYPYTWIKQNYNKFDMILTFDESLLSISDKFKYYAVGNSWIKLENHMIYDKTKNLSIIASGKRQTVGHLLRHQIIREFKNIDVFGNGYFPIENKLEGLKDYRYSLVVENGQLDTYFTEKIIDCFTTGTVPIYYGCSKIGDFFNKDGIIQFNDIKELNNILLSLNSLDYENRLSAIKENFEIAKKYLITEDYIYEKYLINL